MQLPVSNGKVLVLGFPPSILGTDLVIKSRRMDRVSLWESVIRFVGDPGSRNTTEGKNEISRGVAKSVIYQGDM